MKTEAKAVVGHTAGPWLAWITEGKRKEQGVYGPNSETVALCDEDLDMPVETREANARLISAAPELLEACRALCAASTIPGFWIPSEVWVAIKAAIDKAEGRQ